MTREFVKKGASQGTPAQPEADSAGKGRPAGVVIPATFPGSRGRRSRIPRHVVGGEHASVMYACNASIPGIQHVHRPRSKGRSVRYIRKQHDGLCGIEMQSYGARPWWDERIRAILSVEFTPIEMMEKRTGTENHEIRVTHARDAKDSRRRERYRQPFDACHP